MSQGAVSEYLKSLISKQVDDRGLVVWYDPGASLRLRSRGSAPAEHNRGPLRRQLLQTKKRDRPPARRWATSPAGRLRAG